MSMYNKLFMMGIIMIFALGEMAIRHWDDQNSLKYVRVISTASTDGLTVISSGAYKKAVDHEVYLTNATAVDAIAEDSPTSYCEFIGNIAHDINQLADEGAVTREHVESQVMHLSNDSSRQESLRNIVARIYDARLNGNGLAVARSIASECKTINKS